MYNLNRNIDSTSSIERSILLNNSVSNNNRFYALIRNLGLVGALLVLSACANKINDLPKEVELEIPQTWESARPDVELESTKEIDLETPKQPELEVEAEAVHENWLDSFEDPELKRYVGIALKNNPDLLDSAAQLRSAIRQVTVAGSSLWPTVQLSLNGRETQQFFGGADGALTLTTARTVSQTIEIAWEADIWGKLTQRKKAAKLSAVAQAELFKAAELSLAANLSRAWYDLITNKLQLELAQRRLESFENTAKLIDENYQRGIRSALDVYLSRTDVQTQLSALADARFNYVQSLRAFKTLLGEYPNADMEFRANLPELENNVSAGLPAQLLTRRPDIRASQLQYEATIANARAAQRDLYPTLNFSGSIGDARNDFNSVVTDNPIETLVAGIVAPIFASGALRAARDQAYYDAESAYANLLQTTLTAFEEVENSLSREATLNQQHDAITEAVKLAEGGLNLALDQYQAGIENYTTVLQSQQSLFNSLENELNIRNALLQNRIGLHLALGGDFRSAEERHDYEPPSMRKKQKSDDES